MSDVLAQPNLAGSIKFPANAVHKTGFGIVIGRLGQKVRVTVGDAVVVMLTNLRSPLLARYRGRSVLWW